MRTECCSLGKNGTLQTCLLQASRGWEACFGSTKDQAAGPLKGASHGPGDMVLGQSAPMASRTATLLVLADFPTSKASCTSPAWPSCDFAVRFKVA